MDTGGVAVVQPHVQSGHGADMGDAASHLAGADDSDGLDLDGHRLNSHP